LGPLLQFVDRDAAVVKWRTNKPSPTILQLADGQNIRQLEDAAPKTEHEVEIEPLRRNRQYTYRIKTAGEDGAGISPPHSLDTFFNFNGTSIAQVKDPYPNDETARHYTEAARHILSQTKHRDGICLVYGCVQGRLALEIARRSRFRVICVDDDSGRVAAVRATLHGAGAYGTRIRALHVDDLRDLPVPNGFANLVVSERVIGEGRTVGAATEMLRTLRPDGGIACLGQPASALTKELRADLETWLESRDIELKWQEDESGLWAAMLRGPLPGAGNWTHQYGSAANGAYAGEELAGARKAGDLQLQWLGRPGPRYQADRMVRKPAPLAANGRLFMQGLDRMIGVDAHNGVVLWGLEVPGLRRFNIPRDCSNYCADQQYVFLAHQDNCLRIDADTGQVSQVYKVVPAPARDWPQDWSFVASHEDKLIGTATKKGSAYTGFWGKGAWYDKNGFEKVCSDNVFAVDKQSGETRWTYADGVIINSTLTIGDGRIFFVESRNDKVARHDGRIIGLGELWQDLFMVALDTASGQRVWQQPLKEMAPGQIMFSLAFGNGRLVLVSSGANRFHVHTYKADAGEAAWKAVVNWVRPGYGGHMSRPVIVDNRLYIAPAWFDLQTGERKDQLIYAKCGSFSASKNAIFCRNGHSGTVSMTDMTSMESSGWTRLRPDCWLSTIASCGLLLSPEGGGGCWCSVWLETSLAFAPIQHKPPTTRSPVRRFVKSARVELVAPGGEGVIRYTLDGSRPGLDSSVYSEPISVDKPTTINARFFHSQGGHSETAEFSYAPIDQNLAPAADITTTTPLHPGDFLAQYVADEQVMPEGSGGRENGTSWAIDGTKAGISGDLLFRWDEPVEVSEVVYFGRTAWMTKECFKDYEIYLDDADEPVVRGTFEMKHGPQRVAVPTSTIRQLKMRFLNSYDGPNAGAAEIMIFSKSAPDEIVNRVLE
jgi:hypothetical protein